MTATEMKHAAQDEIMHYAMAAYYSLEDNMTMSEEEKEQFRKHLDTQMDRIRRIFGYDLLHKKD